MEIRPSATTAMGALAQRNILGIKASLIVAMGHPLHTSVLETRPLATAATVAAVTRRESEISNSSIAAMEHQAIVKESAIRLFVIDLFSQRH